MSVWQEKDGGFVLCRVMLAAVVFGNAMVVDTHERLPPRTRAEINITDLLHTSTDEREKKEEEEKKRNKMSSQTLLSSQGESKTPSPPGKK